MQFRGIDVSTFQSNIDWKKVKGNGIQFAMLRGGYGRYEKDEKFERNYKNAKAAGVPVGVYHYTYANTVGKAQEEAAFVLSYLKGKQLEYPIAFDVEDKSIQGLSKATLTAIVKAFCEKVEAAGYYVMIYSSKYWFRDKLDMNILGRYDIWLAQWTDKPTYTGTFGMWQYSNGGYVSGVPGRVDMDYAYKDYPAIMKAKGLNGFPKPTAKPTTGSTKPTTGSTKPSTGSSKPAAKKAGDAVKLNKKSLYISATAKKATRTISGTYYLYDGKASNGRYRITTSKANCGKRPIGDYVTGWVAL